LVEGWDGEKRIRLSRHAADYGPVRGFTVEEVETAIRVAPWEAAAEGRWACEHDFEFQGVWNGKRYRTKRVRPIFVEEPEEIVVVTVYVYYF
jgi:hypothetical protein